MIYSDIGGLIFIMVCFAVIIGVAFCRLTGKFSEYEYRQEKLAKEYRSEMRRLSQEEPKA